MLKYLETSILLENLNKFPTLTYCPVGFIGHITPIQLSLIFCFTFCNEIAPMRFR